ncbi:MAG: hypothetical protein M4579_003421 [Chaenotheca gracillima]|nr:MAG: hypothetical protein M4579_003421 [Chaenotheca gracillima]
MDDLSGLNWSGRSTPSASQTSGARPLPSRTPQYASKPSTPDSFANLVSFNSSKQSNNLSLQERQKQLQEEKAKQAEAQRKQFDAQFGGQETKFWDTLGTQQPRRDPSADRMNDASGSRSSSVNPQRLNQHNDEDDDILSAFSAAAPVDSSSHFPPPSSNVDNRPLPARSPAPTTNTLSSLDNNGFPEDDDDPFGLGQMSTSRRAPAANLNVPEGDAKDEDVLGLLGRPVDESTAARKQASPVYDQENNNRTHNGVNNKSEDRAMAELIDMGFPADKAQEALTQVGDENNVQAAVSWLLNEAHRKAKEGSGSQPPRGERPTREDSRPGGRSDHNRQGETGRDDSVPAWMRQSSRSRSAQRHAHNESPGSSDKDITQYASEVGNNLFKSANSLWNTGRKKVQKAVNEFQVEGDPSQPKWMREPQAEPSPARRRSPQLPDSVRNDRDRLERSRKQDSAVTEEAQMLDSGDARPARRQAKSQHSDPQVPTAVPRIARDQMARPAESVSAGFQRKQPPNGFAVEPSRQPLSRGSLSKQLIEEQSSQAYISPSRRKKQVPQPASNDSHLQIDNQSIAGSSRSAPQTNNPFRKPAQSAPSAAPQKLPTRKIPATTPAALASSSTQRQRGTDAFKQGDFAAAQVAYSQALSSIPSDHPITIVILCNRALVNLKVGDPKAAVADADTALSIIGASRGEGETITLGDGQGGEKKGMREFFGKALMRKAEALEQMEKWTDAGKIWREAIDAGFGGPVSFQGRDRCDKASGVSSKPARSVAPSRRPTPAKQPAPAKKSSALHDLSNQPAPLTGERAARLQAANAAAKKTDDERFALTDSVDAKITAWKGGKQDNIRALISSLDTVLWPEAGWKKVGMHELVLPGKVKVAYMKGIAKVHPDKLPQNATTEQRMISGSVFAILNEAWDKFRQENKL